MGLFTKREERGLLPDLPDLPSHETSSTSDHDSDEESYLPGIDSDNYPALPQGINEGRIKSGVDMSDSLSMDRPQNEFKKSKSYVPEPPSTINAPMPSSFQKSSFKENTMRMGERPQKMKLNEPIYIRLDKFQSTHDSLQDIKLKMEEIEHMIAKIKEVKEREEREIEEWEHELQLVKARLESIDTNLFEDLS